jgi:hypothetical protein
MARTTSLERQCSRSASISGSGLSSRKPKAHEVRSLWAAIGVAKIEQVTCDLARIDEGGARVGASPCASAERPGNPEADEVAT